MSMRTLFWGSCAATVATAVGLYFAADYASWHPDSLAARCARGALQLGIECCPGHAFLAQGRVEEPQKECKECGEEACEVVVPAPAVEPQEVIDLSQVGVETASPVPEAEKEGVVTAEPQVEVRTAAVVVAPGDVEECEDNKPAEPPLALDPDVPATMPPCAADDEPATKQVEESAVKEEACDSGWFFFEEKDACPNKQPMCDEPCEKSAHEDGGAEESEPITGGKPADCQVDPNYHQQYPSCPYTGQCYPSTKTNPEETVAPVPEAKKPHKKKAKSDAPQSEAAPTPAGIDEDVPGETAVDTMEFRKSDAKKGEFKPKTW